MLKNPKVFDDRRSYSTIYRWTKDRQLVEWAVMDSMGDYSYPHLIETLSEVLCAYYSQHENGLCKAYLWRMRNLRSLPKPDESTSPHFRTMNNGISFAG